MTTIFHHKQKRSPFRWRKWALRLLLVGFLANVVFIGGLWFSVTDYTSATITQQLGITLPAGQIQAFSFKLPHKNMSYVEIVTSEEADIVEFINELCVAHRSKESLTKEDMLVADATAALVMPFWWQPQNAIKYTAGRCKAVSGVSVKFLVDYTQPEDVTLYLETGADSYFILPPQSNTTSTRLIR